MAAEVGQPAPEFKMPSHLGEPVSLSQYKGQRYVVLSFHVFDFTGG
jgi:peroxiredoxin